MSAERVVIRCDAGPTVGFGHLVRCLSLAQVLREKGADVVFAMRFVGESTLGPNFSVEFPVVVLSNPDNADEGAQLGSDDAAAVLRAAGAGAVVVVDHYGAGEEYLRLLSDGGLRLFVLDDLSNRDLSLADWVLNAAAVPGSQQCRVGRETKQLFGPSYALLRPEFAEVREHAVHSAVGPWRVLVSLGGAARPDAWQSVLEALEAVDVSMDLFCLSHLLPELRVDARHRLTWLGSVAHPAELMATMDIAVTAAGSTVWELCCLGIPMVARATAANQIPNAQILDRADCATVVWRDERAEMTNAIANLLADKSRRAQMRQAGRALVDGLGAQRAAAAVIDEQ